MFKNVTIYCRVILETIFLQNVHYVNVITFNKNVQMQHHNVLKFKYCLKTKVTLTFHATWDCFFSGKNHATFPLKIVTILKLLLNVKGLKWLPTDSNQKGSHRKNAAIFLWIDKKASNFGWRVLDGGTFWKFIPRMDFKEVKLPY